MQPSLHIGNYSLLYRIGCGSFASVYMGINDLIGYPVAIKQIRREIYSTEKEKIRLLREISIMKMAMHQYIAELFEIIDNEDEPYIYLVLELVSNGSIKSMLIPGQPLSEDLSRKIFSQLIVAVGYLHFDLNIIHRDLKAENILLDQNQNIRLIDFGLSTTLTMPSADIQRTACGSPAYAAPEIIVQDRYTESADIWSLGILLYLMTTGHFPFDTSSVTKLLNDIVSTPIEIPTNLSQELQHLLSRILEKNGEARISLIDIMKHPWFKNHGYFNFFQQNSTLSRSYVSNLNINSINCSLKSSTTSTQNIEIMKHLDDDPYRTCFESLVIDDSIDLQIVDELRRKGVNVSSLKSSLMNHEMNEVTACYRIICRSKIMEHFNFSYFMNNTSNYENSLLYPELSNHLQQQEQSEHYHHQLNSQMHRMFTYPINKNFQLQDTSQSVQKNELRSSTIATDAAKSLLQPKPRKQIPSSKVKSKSDQPQRSNIPTKVLPRQNYKRKRFIYSIPKTLGGLEMQSHTKTQMNTNEDIGDLTNIQQSPPQQPQLRQNQPQNHHNRQMLLLKEQHQQQQ